MYDRQFDLDEIRAHLEGTTTSPLFLLDACRWLVDEVERLRTVAEANPDWVQEMAMENNN